MELTDTFELKNGSGQFNYFKCTQHLQQQGRYLYGSSYSIHKSQLQSLYKLLAYASQNTSQCRFYGIDKHKELLITGPENSGKTSLMHLLKPFFQPQHQYVIRSSREVAACYNLFGKDTLEKYLSNNIHYCFDDLGWECFTGHRGGNSELVSQLIQLRLTQSAPTHIITRMKADELKKRYGKHFSNILFQNLNVIEFTKSFNF